MPATAPAGAFAIERDWRSEGHEGHGRKGQAQSVRAAVFTIERCMALSLPFLSPAQRPSGAVALVWITALF